MTSKLNHKGVASIMGVVLFIQMLAPSIVAAANPGRADFFSVMCASNGNVSDEAIAALEGFFVEIDLDDEQNVHNFADCLACCSVKASAPGAQFIQSSTATFSYALYYSYSIAILQRTASGSPLGVRAPPAHL